MKNLKRGFTLSEILITLVLMSFLIMIMASTLKNVTPNQEKIMLKKAYKLTETIVSELVNDVVLYPEDDGEYINRELANTVSVDNYYGTGSVSGSTKFCELFKSRLNVARTRNACGSGNNMRVANPNRNFTTTDGIDWYVTATDFGTGGPCFIDVDVNGFNKGVNCYYDPESPEDCETPDRFRFRVFSSGRVVLLDDIAKEYLKDTKVTD